MQNIENKIILAKIQDKVNESKIKNKIVNTEFLKINQQNIIQKEFNKLKRKNYIFYGGYEEAENKLLIIYPEKINEEILNEEIRNIIKAIKIKLPNELVGKYQHKDYLSSVMKLGLTRQRIGDIIVHNDSAYILVLETNAEYIKNSLKEFTRFKKSNIEIINIDKIKLKTLEFEEISITISSNRLDNFVSQIVKTSRTKAEELILSEKVLLNDNYEIKVTKAIKQEDILTIRGSGKYIIGENKGNNKKGKRIIEIRKYK